MAAKQMSVFRRGHVVSILSAYAQDSSRPLDSHIRGYFRQKEAATLKDKKEVADTVYDLVRHKLYLETTTKKSDWKDLLHSYLQPDFREKQRTCGFPLHIKYSFPQSLVEILSNIYSNKTESLLAALNNRPPLTIRVNTLKTSTSDLMQKWRLKDHINVRKCSTSLYGLHILPRNDVNLFALEDFKEGKFEVQDEASQLCAFQIPAKPHVSVLDYCAGAGGKSLAIAPLMHNTGQIYLHDIRPSLLQEAKKRLKRAGVRNAQIVTNLGKLKGSMDIVVVDVPCTGTGTLKRNPDMKWKFTIDGLKDMLKKQFEIVEDAKKYLKPGGELVYTTCSILPQENLEMIQRLEERLSLHLVSEPFRTSPMFSTMDGFFTARLKLK